MSKAEIQGLDLHVDGAITPNERQALDEAFTEFERDPNPGEPWREVIRQIRKTSG